MPPTVVQAPGVLVDERAARASLRAQIAKLERDLAACATTALPAPQPRRGGPRLLDLGDLEAIRDELAARLQSTREALAREADRQEEYRVLVERMLLDPPRYRWVRVTGADVGERSCKSWHVRPRLGLIGMMAGWWQVKISSGCPSAAAA